MPAMFIIYAHSWKYCVQVKWWWPNTGWLASFPGPCPAFIACSKWWKAGQGPGHDRKMTTGISKTSLKTLQIFFVHEFSHSTMWGTQFPKYIGSPRAVTKHTYKCLGYKEKYMQHIYRNRQQNCLRRYHKCCQIVYLAQRMHFHMQIIIRVDNLNT